MQFIMEQEIRPIDPPEDPPSPPPPAPAPPPPSIISNLQQAAATAGLSGFVNSLLANGLQVVAGSTQGVNFYSNGVMTLDGTLTGAQLLGTFLHEADHHFTEAVMQPAFNYAYYTHDAAYATQLYAQMEASAIAREGLANLSDGRLGYGISRQDFNNIVKQTEDVYRQFGFTNPQALSTFFDDVAANVAQRLLSGPAAQALQNKGNDYVAPAPPAPSPAPPPPPAVSPQNLEDMSIYQWDDEAYSDGYGAQGSYNYGDSDADGSVGDSNGDGSFDYWNGYLDYGWYGGVVQPQVDLFVGSVVPEARTVPSDGNSAPGLTNSPFTHLDAFRLSNVLAQSQAGGLLAPSEVQQGAARTLPPYKFAGDSELRFTP